MNTAAWHLMINHLPIMGVVFSTLILIAGFLLKNQTVKQTALGMFVLTAICAIPAFLTGEGAEEVVENLPGVTESFVERHEDLGKIFLITLSILGVLSLITFFAERAKSKIATILYGILLIAGIGTAIFAKQVGTSGGEIRHTEIRSDAGATNAVAPETGGEEGDD